MSFRIKPAAAIMFAMVASLGCAGGAGAASVYGVLPFQNTGASPPSHYKHGSSPESSLLQASDGNFYGTTAAGGTGSCPLDVKPHNIVGCGTIFRIDGVTGAETVVFSFPYDAATETAPDGAVPTAGLIQGQDGALYGMAQYGGIVQCEDPNIMPSRKGCGTLFRISTTGVFTLLHQFCGTQGCPGVDEGANPAYNLVQTADGTLHGTTPAGGDTDNGTLFSASTSGAVTTLLFFHSYQGGTPYGALLVGQDGSTLYGVYTNGVYSYGAAGLTPLYTIRSIYLRPSGALIFGPDGLLYGYTLPGAQPGTLYSLSTTGDYTLEATLPPLLDTTGLLLGSDGMIYGTMIGETPSTNAGGLFVYNPTTKAVRGLVQFDAATTGGYPEGALIEGNDHYLYGSNAEGGPTNSFGVAGGTLFRIGPQLAK